VRSGTGGAGASAARRLFPAVAAIARTNVAGAASDSTIASTPIDSKWARLALSSLSNTPSTARPRACTSSTNARVSAGQR
jgi:hypothetical protein